MQGLLCKSLPKFPVQNTKRLQGIFPPELVHHIVDIGDECYRIKHIREICSTSVTVQVLTQCIMGTWSFQYIRLNIETSGSLSQVFWG